MPIDELFFLPPMAIARLGGSDIPLASFTWAEDPSLYGAGLTVIVPDISLEVTADGSVRPFLPAFIQFRDGKLLRPLAPFFELWLRSGDVEQPLTLKWLQENKLSLSDIQYTVTAANRKAARRSGDLACEFSATESTAADNHTPLELLAVSSGNEPLVLPDNPINLGRFQALKPTPATAMGVDLSVLRIRFTPARGLVYGPPSATTAIDTDTNRAHEIVPEANRILNPASAWVQYSSNNRRDNPQPSDTYDGADDSSRRNLSFGVVDDTCDVLLEASIRVGKRSFDAAARAFVAPPDFAPDRRPFCSLAEELVDREAPVRDSAEDLPDALQRVGDLFQRVYETASLANVDMMRNAMMPGNDRGLVNFANLPKVIQSESMTPKDAPYFDRDQDLNSPPSSHEKLPYSSIAAQTHAPLANTDDLAQFLRTSAPQIRRLVRPAYAPFRSLQEKVNPSAKPDPTQRDPRNLRDNEHDMRMPPYMRDSDASPLSLNRRQYDFLMQTIGRLQKPGADGAAIFPPNFGRAQEHAARVVKRLTAKSSGTRTRASKPSGNSTKPAGSAKGRKK